MPIVEAVTVTRYRVANPPKGWRRRGLRGIKRLAYRDAAWAKIHARCKCTFPVREEDPPRTLCRYHDREYRSHYVGPEDPPAFDVPAIWNLPRRDDWDYGRAVAFRLARLYRYLDAKQAPADSRSETPDAGCDGGKRE